MIEIAIITQKKHIAILIFEWKHDLTRNIFF